MKTKFIFILTVIIFVSITCSKATKEDKPEWKGEIEYEDGVKIVKNPSEPVYGDIILDLEEDLSIGREDDDNYMFHEAANIATDSQENIYVLDSGNFRIQKFDHNGQYLQTIGKKGQGPGEFENPSRVFLDTQDNIYVTDGGGKWRDSRLMKIFNSRGEFVKAIYLDSPISDFYIDSEGNIFAYVTQRDERGKKAVVKMNSEGKIIKSIAEFSEPKKSVTIRDKESAITFIALHNYTPRLCFSPLNEQTFSYAYSTEYQVFIMNNEGKSLLKIQKNEVLRSINQSEKKHVIERLQESISRSGRKWPEGVLEEALNFPSTRPFFRRIIVDDLQRLFLWRVGSVLDKSEEREFDLFNKEGYYLYLVKIPVLPRIIKKGFLYDIKEDEETGEVFIRRFRIKNWDQIKEGI